jgi:SAM-dependent methyltransferase
MSFKQDYHLNKILYWNNYDRNYLAKREFNTITYLLKVFSNFELKKGFRVLDLGSGDQFLKNEFDKRGIIYFSRDIKDLDFEKDKFDFEDNKFDLVLSLAVLEHLKNPDIFLSESRRVLKEGSFLFLSTPNWKYSKNIFYDDVTHVKPYSPESLTEILSIKNFQDIKIMPNLRCKSKWWYEGRFKFFLANYLAVFSNNVRFVPKFFKGQSKGMFSISKKNN